MFARKVCVQLKADSLTRFAQLMDDAILSWLQTKEGFLGLITLAAPNRLEVQVISFWDQERNADAFDSTGFPVAMKILGTFIEGGPLVKTFNVIGSTLEPMSQLLKDAGEPEGKAFTQRADYRDAVEETCGLRTEFTDSFARTRN
jgi:hypothetical protein